MLDPTAALQLLSTGVTTWLSKKMGDKEELRKKRKAAQLVMAAAIETKAYLYDIKANPASREREIALAGKWQKASFEIYEYDELLSASAQLKALGYADPREWSKAELVPTIIKLDYIMEKCAAILEKG